MRVRMKANPGREAGGMTLLTTEARTLSCCLTRTMRKLPRANKPREGLDSFREPRAANRDEVDPDVLPGLGAARRSFWGGTVGGPSPLGRGKGPMSPTPYYCLVPPGAEVQARTFPVPTQLAKGQAHLGATCDKAKKNRPRRRNLP